MDIIHRSLARREMIKIGLRPFKQMLLVVTSKMNILRQSQASATSGCNFMKQYVIRISIVCSKTHRCSLSIAQALAYIVRVSSHQESDQMLLQITKS